MSPQPFLFRGPWLHVMRALWVAIVAIYVIVNAIGMIEVARQYSTLTGVALVAGYTQWTRQGLLEALHAAGLSVSFWAVSNLVSNALIVLLFLAMGGLLFLRRSGDWFAWFASLFLMTFGLIFTGGIPALSARDPASGWLTNMLALPWLGLYVFFYAFPDGRFVPRWTAVWTIVLSVVFFSPLAGTSFYGWVVILSFLSALFAQGYRYWRVSNATQRSQTRWVLYTITLIAVVEIVLQGLVPAILPAVTVEGAAKLAYSLLLNALAAPVFGLLPAAIAIAILRYRLWDIDVIIRRTVVYGTLTALLLAVYFGGVVVLQQVFVALTGQRSEVAVILSTLAIYALAVPLRNRIQALIDRRFYRRKVDAAAALEGFAAATRNETDLGTLAHRLIDVVDETMQPERVTLWLAGESGPPASSNVPRNIAR